MHKLQKILLKRLQLQNNQRYGSLTSGYDFEDNVAFHLDKLIRERYVNKEQGIYSITLEGIKEISKYDEIELVYGGVKTFFIGLLCADDMRNYLIKSHKNAKSDFNNLPSGKPFFGESIDAALTRIFRSYTGIDLPQDSFKFISLHLKTIKTNDGEAIFDDAFTIYSVNVDANLKSQIMLNDSVEWYSIDQIKRLENKWPEIDICILNEDFANYKVYAHISNYIL